MIWQIIWFFKWILRPSWRNKERILQIANLINNYSKPMAIQWLRRDLGVIDWGN